MPFSGDPGRLGTSSRRISPGSTSARNDRLARLAPSSLHLRIQFMASEKKPKTTTGRKRAPAKRMPKKAAAGSRGIEPRDTRLDAGAAEIAEVSRRIEQEGGAVIGTYRVPLGGNPV